MQAVFNILFYNNYLKSYLCYMFHLQMKEECYHEKDVNCHYVGYNNYMGMDTFFTSPPQLLFRKTPST